MKELKGTGVALVTPFKSDKSIDFEGLAKVVNHVVEGGVDYLVALGTTAETATMTTHEKDEVLAHIKKINAARVPLVVGIGGNNTAALLDEFNRINLDGVCAILSASPYYNKPTQEGIYQHYKLLAEHSPLPIILYNVPGRTASNMSAATTLRLARDFENIVAIKEASGNLNQVMEIIASKPTDFMVISGEDALNFPIIACGGEGVISVLANSLPDLCSKVVNYSLGNNNVKARESHYKSLSFINLLFEEGNPAGVKAALEIQEVCKCEVRLPLVEAGNGLKERLKKALSEFTKK